MKRKFNEGYYHEALDRTWLIIDMIQNYLLDHPACHKHLEIAQKIEKAQELLSEAYQDFGQF